LVHQLTDPETIRVGGWSRGGGIGLLDSGQFTNVGHESLDLQLRSGRRDGLIRPVGGIGGELVGRHHQNGLDCRARGRPVLPGPVADLTDCSHHVGRKCLRDRDQAPIRTGLQLTFEVDQQILEPLLHVASADQPRAGLGIGNGRRDDHHLGTKLLPRPPAGVIGVDRDDLPHLAIAAIRRDAENSAPERQRPCLAVPIRARQRCPGVEKRSQVVDVAEHETGALGLQVLHRCMPGQNRVAPLWVTADRQQPVVPRADRVANVLPLERLLGVRPREKRQGGLSLDLAGVVGCRTLQPLPQRINRNMNDVRIHHPGGLRRQEQLERQVTEHHPPRREGVERFPGRLENPAGPLVLHQAHGLLRLCDRLHPLRPGRVLLRIEQQLPPLEPEPLHFGKLLRRAGGGGFLVQGGELRVEHGWCCGGLPRTVCRRTARKRRPPQREPRKHGCPETSEPCSHGVWAD